MCTAWEFGLHH